MAGSGAGYSGTPLPQKLGIKPGATVLLLDAPPQAAEWLEPLPEGVRVSTHLGAAKPASVDVLLVFLTQHAALLKALPRAKRLLKPDGGLWLAWPKKSAAKEHGIRTDLDENLIRAAGLAMGLVDNKVCAVSDIWSGLRLVYRVRDRPAAARPGAQRAPSRRAP